MMSARTTFCILAVAWLCGSATSIAVANERVQLTRAQLMSAATATEGPVANHYITPQVAATKAPHVFSGTIGIPEHPM